MPSKTYITKSDVAPVSQIGATLESLAATIEKRKALGADGDAVSYTAKLLNGPLDIVLKKVSEESLEVALAAKETQMLCNQAVSEVSCQESVDHMRYEAADVIYHLLVLLSRFDVPIDELAAELNYRMTEEERPCGCVLLKPEHVRRGK